MHSFSSIHSSYILFVEPIQIKECFKPVQDLGKTGKEATSCFVFGDTLIWEISQICRDFGVVSFCRPALVIQSTPDRAAASSLRSFLGRLSSDQRH